MEEVDVRRGPTLVIYSEEASDGHFASVGWITGNARDEIAVPMEEVLAGAAGDVPLTLSCTTLPSSPAGPTRVTL